MPKNANPTIPGIESIHGPCVRNLDMPPTQNKEQAMIYVRNRQRPPNNEFQMAWGTDMLFDAELARKQGTYVAKMKRWFKPYEIMKMVTSNNAELLAMAGPRVPYQEGALGVVREGAYADLILVDGNPLEDIDLVADAEANFDLIMKDGMIFKTLCRE